jgi:GNAT superfamily N-acetyltransferase
LSGTTRRPGPPAAVEVVPLTGERWPDFQALFAPNASANGCQCTWFFRLGTEFRAGVPEGNRAAIRARGNTAPPPGLLAYVDGTPAGWCAFGPREAYPRLERSRLFPRPDTPGTWAIVCFFVATEFRGLRLMDRLIAEAVGRARAAGAGRVEAYPVTVPPRGRTDSGSGYHGFVGPFRRSGFRVVARPSKGRALVLRELVAPPIRASRVAGSASGRPGFRPTSSASRPTASPGRRRGPRRRSRRSTRGTPAG